MLKLTPYIIENMKSDHPLYLLLFLTFTFLHFVMLKLPPQHFKVYEANVKKSESIGVENDFSFLFFQLFSFFNLFILFFQKKKKLIHSFK